MPILVLILILVPLAEIALFITIGSYVGVAATLACILITAFIGAFLMRNQGLRVLREAQVAIDRGEPPLRQLFDGFCVFVAGAFLLTPGFLTDTIGFLLLIPGLRAWLGHGLWQMLERNGGIHIVNRGGPGAGGFGGGSRTGPGIGPGGMGPGMAPGAGTRGPRPGAPAQRPGVIDAEFREVDDDEPGSTAPPEDSKWGREGRDDTGTDGR